jgi:hypothetical protein
MWGNNSRRVSFTTPAEMRQGALDVNGRAALATYPCSLSFCAAGVQGEASLR